MSKIALFFGPQGGSVDRVTNKLADIIGRENVEVLPVLDAKASDVEKYNKIIFLSSAIGLDQWDMVDVKDDWDKFFPELDKLNFENKKVALVGLGDHIKYPSHFVSSMGTLAEVLIKNKAVLSGAVSVEGYEFEESEAVNKKGLFYGLPIDEDNEDELTTERLTNWVESIKSDFGI